MITLTYGMLAMYMDLLYINFEIRHGYDQFTNIESVSAVSTFVLHVCNI